MMHQRSSRMLAAMVLTVATVIALLVADTHSAQSNPTPPKPEQTPSPFGVLVASNHEGEITLAAQASVSVRQPRIRRSLATGGGVVLLAGDPCRSSLFDRPGVGEHVYDLIDLAPGSDGAAEVAITSRLVTIRATQPLTFLGGTARRGVFALTLPDGSERQFAVSVGERIGAFFLADPKDADGSSTVIDVSTDLVLDGITLEPAPVGRRTEVLHNPDGSPVLGVDGEPLTISVAGASRGDPTATARIRTVTASETATVRRLASGQSVSIPAIR